MSIMYKVYDLFQQVKYFSTFTHNFYVKKLSKAMLGGASMEGHFWLRNVVADE